MNKTSWLGEAKFDGRVASIGKIASPTQGVTYYERDGYYAKDDPAHREASAWADMGAEALGLSGRSCRQIHLSSRVLKKRLPGHPYKRGLSPRKSSSSIS